ncbi:melanization protease 1-like isoform X2 [Photinus pyralis]|uniref:melanization protease 1-like isoform X2 n=1 Tax=Photinus pyralis TaxID=7054 RepID=UPI00126700BF|nr:melanization protease 1-like isoform X2 [Photinus pyralis]
MVKNVIWIPSSLLLCFTGFILCANDRLASRRFCGYQHSDEYSRDSPNVTINEFPWVAQLLYDDKRRVRCTGSLINNRYVLTSAQCVSNNQNLVGVRLGDFNRTSVEDCVHHTIFGEECSEPVQEFEIDEIIPHPKFNKSTSEDDIAVIRLSHNAQYTDYIRPICLPIPGSRDIGDKELALSGWGILGRLQNITEVKKKILASFVGLEECNAVYNKSVVMGMVEGL